MKKATLLLLILMIPIATAFQITDTSFTFNNQEITTIPSELAHDQILGYFSVEYEGNFRSQIIANLSNIYKHPARDYSNERLTCTRTQTGGTCVSNIPYRIYTQDAQNIIYFDNTLGLKAEYAHVFQIRTEKPTVTQITITPCNSNTCFIRSGQSYSANITFQQQENFSMRGIFYGFTMPNQVTNTCQGTTCSVMASTTCTEGNLNFIIDPASRNNFGQYVTGMLTKQVTCDNTRPVIENVQLPQETLQTSLNIPFKINVTEELSPNIQLEFKIAQTGYNQTIACTNKQQQKFVCEGNINLGQTSINPGLYQLQIIARDLAGNADTKNHTIRILQEDQTTATNWRVSRTEMAHRSINVETLIFPRESYASFELTEPNSNLAIQDIQINPNNCVPRTVNVTGKQGMIQNFKLVSFDENSLITKFTMQNYGNNNIYSGLNQLVFDCPITIRSRTTSSIIQTPQNLNVTLSITLRSSQRLDQMLTESLERRLEEAEQTANTINTLRNTFAVAQFICGATNGIHGIFGSIGTAIGALETSAVAAQGIPIFGQAFGGGVQATSEGTTAGYAAIREKIKKEWGICKLFTCDRDLNLLQADTSISRALAPFAEVESLENYALDPYKSIVTASLTACLPAVVYHVERFQNVHCEYVACLASGVAMQGIDPAFCRESRAMAQCVILAESVTNLFVPYELFQRAVTNVRNLLSNPGAFVSGTMFYAACHPSVRIFGAGTCKTFQSATSLYESGQVLINMGEAMLSRQDSSCERSLAVVEAYSDYFKNPQRYDVPPFSEEDSDYRKFSRQTNVGADKVAYCKGNNCGLFARQGFNASSVTWANSLIKQGEASLNPFDDGTNGIILNKQLGDDLNPADLIGFQDFVGTYKSEAISNLGPNAQDLFNRIDSHSGRIDEANQRVSSLEMDVLKLRQNIHNFEDVRSAYVAPNREKISSLQSELDDLNQKDHELLSPNEVVSLEGRIAWINQEIPLLQNNIAYYESDEFKNTFNENLAKKEQELQQAKDNVTRVENELDVNLNELWREQTFSTTYGQLKFLYQNTRGWQIIDKYLPLSNNNWADLNLFGLIHIGNLGFMNDALYALDQVSDFERRICQEAMRDERTFSEEFNLINRAGAGFRLGMYVIAKRTTLENPTNNELEYTYIIGGTINPKLQANYTVVLKNNNAELDITRNITTNNRLTPNQNNPIGNRMSNQGFVKTNILYDEVCLRFNQPLVNLFDIVRDVGFGFTGTGTSTVCKPISQE
jgi:hypothetical protein